MPAFTRCRHHASDTDCETGNKWRVLSASGQTTLKKERAKWKVTINLFIGRTNAIQITDCRPAISNARRRYVRKQAQHDVVVWPWSDVNQKTNRLLPNHLHGKFPILPVGIQERSASQGNHSVFYSRWWVQPTQAIWPSTEVASSPPGSGFRRSILLVGCIAVQPNPETQGPSEEPDDVGASLLDSSDDEDAQDVPNRWSHLV
jgi:hypothetical protein